jgi:hypothetical protein
MTAAPGIHPESTVVVAPDVLSTQLGSEQVMLNLRDGTYYGLDEVGSEIWRLVQQPIRVSDICDAILDAYDVDPGRCREDVIRLLGELMQRGLVELRPSIR